MTARKKTAAQTGSADAASRNLRQAFWLSIMQNEDHDLKDRLKASELFGKSEGDFVERLDVSGKLDLAQLIAEGRKRVADAQ